MVNKYKILMEKANQYKRSPNNESYSSSKSDRRFFNTLADRNYSVVPVCFTFLISEFICMIICSNISLEIAKKNFVPSIKPNFDTVNLRFGSIVSAIVVAFICFNLLIAHFLPIGIEKVFPIEDNKWTKFGFNIFLAIINFFFAGFAGFVTSIFHIVVTFFILVVDLAAPYRHFDDSLDQHSVY